MSKLLKFIVHFVVICTILCVLALAVPPFFGVTTQIQDDAGVITNLPLGSVAYAIPTRAEEVQMGDSILVHDNGAVYRLNVGSLDLGTGRGTVMDPAVTNAEPIPVAFGEYIPKIFVVVPFIGYLLKATQSLEGLVILGLAVLFLIILYVIAELWKPRRDEEEDDYYMEDTEPGYVKTGRELRQDEKNRKRAMRREEEQVRQEEKYRRKNRGGKIRTGGFVDEVDESDFDEDDYFDEEEVDSMYSATTEAHEALRRGVAAATQEREPREPAQETRTRAASRSAASSQQQQQQPARRKSAGSPANARRSASPYRNTPRREVEPEREEEPVYEESYKKLAIPRYSKEQMARKAELEGDEPDMVTDDVTGVTQFDYSDLLFNGQESPMDDDDDF